VIRGSSSQYYEQAQKIQQTPYPQPESTRVYLNQPISVGSLRLMTRDWATNSPNLRQEFQTLDFAATI